MPPAPALVFNRSEFRGKTIHFRRGYLILKVYSQDEGLAEVMAVIRDVMGGISFDARRNIVGRWAYLSLDPATDILTLVKDLKQNPQVEYAEPDLRMTGSVEVREPGDPYLYSGETYHQWGIKDINLPEVWKIQSGDTSALIGLVDSGVPIKGEDDDGSLSLHDRLTNAIDHVDFDGSRFIAGYNHLYATPTVWPKDISGYFHGSHMAGIIAAKENNKDHEGNFIGTAGVNWGSDVYVSVVMDSGGKSTIGLVYLAVAEILEYAAGHGNPNVVINLSINYSDTDLEEVSDPGAPGTPGRPVLVGDPGTGADTGTPDEPGDTDPADTPVDPMSSMNDMFGLIVGAGAIICISAGNGDLYEDGTLIEQPARMGVEKSDYAPHVIAVGSIDKGWSIGEHSGRGIEDMVFAPGEDVCTIHTRYSVHKWYQDYGSSVANAHVSGLAALLWSEDPSLTASEVVKCIKNTCQFPTGYDDVTIGDAEYLSHGIVNANAALQAIRGYAELLTPSLVFEGSEPDLDHEKEIEIEVTSCQAVTFTVTVAGHAFGITPGSYSHDPCSAESFKLAATYSATDGDTESGIVTVVWDQRPRYRWEIGISARRLRSRNSLFLVLDKSGSMGNSSGIGTYTRLEVLQYSAGILVDLLDLDNGMGTISFDGEAHDLTAYTVISPEAPDTARALLKSGIDSLEPGGATSIVAGIMAARDHLDTLPEEDTKAIILLTDGKETHEPWLEDLLPDDIGYPVFIIGMGTATSLEPDSLSIFAELSDGYCVLTGSLDDATENVVAEFLSQILADIVGDSVTFDPTQHLRPDTTHRFPIRLSEADKGIEVILMRPVGAPLDYKVFGPAGWRLAPEKLDHFESDRLIRFRFRGPAAHQKAEPPVNGIWQVEVSTAQRGFSDWIKDRKKNDWDTSRLELHGAPYTFRVHARSNLRMKCRVSQSGYSPGSTLFLHVRLTDRGRPLQRQPSVTAEVTDPLGRVRTLLLTHGSNGIYETSVEARATGIHTWRITAEGQTLAGHAFRRECRLTGAVLRPEQV